MIGSAKAINAFKIGPSVRTTCLFLLMFFSNQCSTIDMIA